MAYDGTLKFSTKIDRKGFDTDIKKLSQLVKNLGKNIENSIGNKGTQSIKKFNKSINDTFTNLNKKVKGGGFSFFSGKGLSGIGVSLSNIGKIAVAAIAVKAVGALLQLGKSAIELSANLNEVQNVVDTVFPTSSDQINSFAENAIDKFGLSELSAKQFASTMGAILKPTGLAEKQIADMAIVLTQASGGMASFFNKSADVVQQDIQSFFAGSTETMYKYGLAATEANLQTFALSKGIKKSVGEMTQAEKQVLRYNFLVDNLGYTFGDFEKTIDSFSNQQRLLNERWKQFLGLIGDNLIRVLTPALKVLNNLLLVLIAATEQFNAFINSVSGGAKANTSEAEKQLSAQTKITTEGGQAVDNQGNMTEEVKNTNKALKGTLASFDDLNVLQKKSSGDIAGIEDEDTTLDIVVDGLDDAQQASEITPVFGKLAELFDFLSSIDFSNLSESITRLGKSLEPFTPYVAATLNLIGNALKGLTKIVIEETLPGFLDNLSEKIEETGKRLQLFERIYNDVFEPVGVATVALLTGDMETFGKSIADARDGIGKLGEDFIGLETSADGSIKRTNIDFVGFADFITDLFTFYLPGLDWFEFIPNDAREQLNKTNNNFILFSSQLTAGWVKTGIDISGETVSFGTNIITTMLGVVAGILKGFTSLSVSIPTVLGEIAKNVKSGVNVWIGIFESFFNTVINGLNSLINRLNTVSFDIPDWVPEIGGRSFGFNVGRVSNISIPRLATGTVLPGGNPYLAVVNDQPSGQTNIETPLDTMIEAFETALSNNNTGGGNTTIVLEIDGQEFARATAPFNRAENVRRGTTLRMVST